MNPLAKTDDKATIADVARLAGVSIKTVSRVANGLPHVSDVTREKVQRAIDSLDYSANPYAKHLGSLKNSPHKHIAVLVAKPSEAEANQAPRNSPEIDWW